MDGGPDVGRSERCSRHLGKSSGSYYRAGAIWGKRREGSTDGRADEDSDKEAELSERRESIASSLIQASFMALYLRLHQRKFQTTSLAEFLFSIAARKIIYHVILNDSVTSCER